MLTLCIRYSINPNKITEFKTYVGQELQVIRRSGGNVIGYFFPTDYAGATNEALGLIDFPTLAEYEQYRSVLAKDPEHKTNVLHLEQSGAVIKMERSIIQRAE